MLLPESEVIERIESPLNLINRLRSGLSHRRDKISIPSLPPSSSEIIENLDEKLALGSIKTKASGIMSTALDELKGKLVQVEKPKELANIAEQMSKILSNTERKEGSGNTNIAHVVIYAPQITPEEQFDVIDVSRKE